MRYTKKKLRQMCSQSIEQQDGERRGFLMDHREKNAYGAFFMGKYDMVFAQIIDCNAETLDIALYRGALCSFT